MLRYISLFQSLHYYYIFWYDRDDRGSSSFGLNYSDFSIRKNSKRLTLDNGINDKDLTTSLQMTANVGETIMFMAQQGLGFVRVYVHIS